MFWKTEDGEVDKRCLFLVLLLTGVIVAGGLYICSPFFLIEVGKRYLRKKV